MSSFEEYAYTKYLEEQAEKEKGEIDKTIYQLLCRKAEIDQEILGIVEYKRSLINEIIIK